MSDVPRRPPPEARLTRRAIRFKKMLKFTLSIQPVFYISASTVAYLEWIVFPVCVSCTLSKNARQAHDIPEEILWDTGEKC